MKKVIVIIICTIALTFQGCKQEKELVTELPNGVVVEYGIYDDNLMMMEITNPGERVKHRIYYYGNGRIASVMPYDMNGKVNGSFATFDIYGGISQMGSALKDSSIGHYYEFDSLGQVSKHINY